MRFAAFLALPVALFFAASVPAQAVQGTRAARTGAPPAPAHPVPAAVIADPPRDTRHPARMEVLRVPTGGVHVNGIAYLASGPGPRPTLVVLHGLPGNEKNQDLLQAVRRAGWHAVTINYRGSWGSPGAFRFAGVLDDATALLAFLRDSANARRLGVDPSRLVLAGHSMGGWAAAHVGARDGALRGVLLVSAADMGRYAGMPREQVVRSMAGNMESLAGTSAERMADELLAEGTSWTLDRAAAGLARTPLLVLGSDDGGAPATDRLAAAVRAAGNRQVTTRHVATGHGWDDRRITLAAAMVHWLQSLQAPPR